MKKKNFTPKRKVTLSIVALLLLFFISVPQQIDAQTQCPLAANDLVQVSLDQNCEANLTPEMILEGEGNNCQYLIKGIWEEDGTEVPYVGIPGNYILTGEYLGQVLTAWVGYDDPFNLLAVEGKFYLQDKLPPTLNCLDDVVVSCNEDLTDYLNTNTDALYPTSATLPIVVPAGGSLFLPVDVNNVANQSEILDELQVVLGLTSTFGVQVVVHAPLGVSPNILNSPFIDGYFDELQMTDDFFNGQWSIEIRATAGATTVNALSLSLESTSFMTSPYGLVDNCQVDEVFVISDETVDIKDCGDWSAIRTIVFQGVDASGMMSNVCTHTVYYERKTVLDIVWPLNRDDYQLDALSCSNIPTWDANGDGYPQPEESGLPTVDGISVAPNSGYTGYCEIGLTYTDQVIEICTGTFKVLRLWTAVNCCGPTGQDNPINHYQIIKVADDEGPIVSICFPDLEVPANPFSCETDVLLPGPFDDPSCPMVIYDCNMETVTYSVAYKIGDCANPPGSETPWEYSAGIVQLSNGNYKLLDIPAGCAWIKYTFTDGCGNSTDAFFEVIVIDNIPPVAVCDEHTVVTVTGECTARAFAKTFDDGSFDNCSEVTFQVRRMTGNCGGTHVFGDYVEFCSGDIGKTIQVVLKVIDAEGNFNTCMVEAYIDDKTPPYVVCPENIEISCEQNYLDLDVTGHPDAYDNCGVESLTYVDSGSLNQCNVGTIYRTWTVVDFGGRTHSCTQTITIVDYKLFTWNDIKWPKDVLNLEGCINADTNPSNTGSPVLDDDFCSLVAYTYEDQVFTLVEDACYKILRTWTVLDWCQFDQTNTSSTGMWSYTQVIMVYNYDAPVFTSSCDDVEICGYNSDCTGDVELTATAEDECTPTDELVWEYRVDFYGDGTINHFGFTNTYSQTHVPLGTHTIHWTVEELCGNISTCSYEFTVRDCKKPTPVCISEITTVLMPTSGMVSIKACDFDHGSYDNCTSGSTCSDCSSDLFYSFSEDVNDTTKIFTIADIGLNEVQMWVTDEHGNQDYCEVSVMIQDNANLSGMVGGTIATEEEAPVSGVSVELEETNAFESVFESSNNEGYYQMQGNYENGDYKITGMKDDLYSNGVSTLDLVIIQKHLLGILPLTSPYKILAADADNNNSVSANDLFQLRKLILGVQDELPASEAWNFVSEDYVFTSPQNPWLGANEDKMYNIELRNLNSDEMHNDFVAIKIGDVNGSVSQFINGETVEGRSMVQLFAENQNFKAQESVLIPVFASDFNQIAGMQFTIDFDAETFEYVTVLPGSIELNAQHVALIENGKLNLSWNQANGISVAKEDALFTIELRAKTNGQLMNQITLNSTKLNAEVYTDALETMKVGFDIRTKENNGFVLYQNTPNPFENETAIVFELPNSGSATLTVYDLTGKVLKTISGEFVKGMNSVNMSKDDLQASGGVLYYQLETDNDTAVRKMIMLK